MQIQSKGNNLNQTKNILVKPGDAVIRIKKGDTIKSILSKHQIPVNAENIATVAKYNFVHPDKIVSNKPLVIPKQIMDTRNEFSKKIDDFRKTNRELIKEHELKFKIMDEWEAEQKELKQKNKLLKEIDEINKRSH